MIFIRRRRGRTGKEAVMTALERFCVLRPTSRFPNIKPCLMHLLALRDWRTGGLGDQEEKTQPFHSRSQVASVYRSFWGAIGCRMRLELQARSWHHKSCRHTWNYLASLQAVSAEGLRIERATEAKRPLHAGASRSLPSWRGEACPDAASCTHCL